MSEKCLKVFFPSSVHLTLTCDRPSCSHEPAVDKKDCAVDEKSIDTFNGCLYNLVSGRRGRKSTYQLLDWKRVKDDRYPISEREDDCNCHYNPVEAIGEIK